MNYSYYQRLCIKSITGDIQENEKKKLDAWFLVSEENKKEYQKMADLWRNSISQQEPIFPDIDDEWIKIANRIENEKETIKSLKIINKYNISSFFTPAFRLNTVYVGVAALIIAFVLFLTLRQNNPVAQNVFFSSERVNRTIQLPDGSTVLLNCLSHVEYSEPMNKNVREIKLKGEGYFSVIHEKRPFIITTDNARITVVGTKFDVKTGNEKTSVVVREGYVKLSQSRGNLKEIDLLSGQKSIVIKDQEPRAPIFVNSDFLLEWMNGKFVYDRTPLYEIADDLQKYYNVRISFSDDKIKPLTLTGTFTKDNLENILSEICIANGLNYRKVNGEYFIRQDL